MPSTKRKSTYDTSDPFVASDPDSPKPTNKRSKPTTTTSSSSKHPQRQTDTDGNPYWSISTARRVTVSDFKGKKMVSVREYYQKDEVWLPGKKGITMTLEQYAEFIKVLPQIERALGKEGEKVGRPVYGGAAAVEEEDDELGDGDEDGDEEIDRKANIEATSDEDED